MGSAHATRFHASSLFGSRSHLAMRLLWPRTLITTPRFLSALLLEPRSASFSRIVVTADESRFTSKRARLPPREEEIVVQEECVSALNWNISLYGCELSALDTFFLLSILNLIGPTLSLLKIINIFPLKACFFVGLKYLSYTKRYSYSGIKSRNSI